MRYLKYAVLLVGIIGAIVGCSSCRIPSRGSSPNLSWISEHTKTRWPGDAQLERSLYRSYMQDRRLWAVVSIPDKEVSAFINNLPSTRRESSTYTTENSFPPDKQPVWWDIDRKKARRAMRYQVGSEANLLVVICDGEHGFTYVYVFASYG